MDLDEFPLLNEPNVMLVSLKCASKGPAGPAECLKALEESIRTAGLSMPSETDQISRRIEMSYHYLHVAQLVESTDTDRFTITQRGQDVLRAHPKGIDSSVLVKFPEFRTYIGRPRREQDRTGEEPTKEYDEGYIAQMAGASITDNPYSIDNIAHLEWENGWCEACDEEHEGNASVGRDNSA